MYQTFVTNKMIKKMVEIGVIIILCCINFATILLAMLIGQHGLDETLNKLLKCI